jgi:hypothetical protein
VAEFEVTSFAAPVDAPGAAAVAAGASAARAAMMIEKTTLIRRMSEETPLDRFGWILERGRQPEVPAVASS